MGIFADNLVRLRVAAASGVLPPDLGEWALRQLDQPAAARRAGRDELLREAAGLVSGSAWAKAGRLRNEAQEARRHPALRQRALDDGVQELVARASKLAPVPISRRQLLRILDASED